MQKRWLTFLAYTLISAAMLSSAFAAGYYTHSVASDVRGQYPLLSEAITIVQRNFFGPMPSATGLEYGMIRGMVTALNDPYTTFIEPEQAELDTDNMQGTFGGIGAAIQQNEAGEFMLTPFRDSPAERAGILAGDVLVAVEGTPITPDMAVDEIVALIRGEVGTDVALTVRTGTDAPRTYTITREEFELPSTTWRILEQDPTVGLIDIDRFSERTPDEVELGLEELRDGGATRLVLDLRGNGGGLLDASVNVAGLFLDGGAVLYEASRDKPERTFDAPSGTAAEDAPVVVLVDGGTASAAEIVAGALRDRGRAPLIGQSTYGKGSVQLVFSLSDGSSLHVTNARWFTPSRTPIDATGLLPDIVVGADAQGDDPVLARAVEYLDNLP